MEKTGEKYNAARRVLIDQAAKGADRVWIAEPETSDESVQAATGRNWNEWCDVIDAWSGRTDGHAAIAAHLENAHGVDGWWAQTVTVGYERITGLRLPHQRPDGTFTAGKTRTVHVDGDLLRSMLLDEGERESLFPGLESELRSRPSAKVLRIGIGPGVAQINIEPRNGGTVRISIAHERLPAAEDVPRWKHYWSEWLEALDES